MAFSDVDVAAVARSLAQIAEREDDLVDAFLERSEIVELPVNGERPGLQVVREEGFALRLVRGDRTWLATRDGLAPKLFSEALRQVARAQPQASYPEPRLSTTLDKMPGEALEVLEFPTRLDRAIRARHVAFPRVVRSCRHRRWVQVIGTRVVTAAEEETFYSVAVDTPWWRYGTLATTLDEAAAERMAEQLVARFRAREAPAAEAVGSVTVFGPGATAVVLHEAVAHALEVDTLELTGRPESVLGLEMARPDVHVLDDPASAPEGVRRTTDDEGASVVRRWLLRAGAVEELLADRRFSRRYPRVNPGAARRAHRSEPPTPRSTHLELLPGPHGEADLLTDAAGGLYVPELDAGRLEPLSGRFELSVPYAYPIRGGRLGDPTGGFRLSGRVADLLGSITAVASESIPAGAGWCAKSGRRLPVWATAPAIRVDGLGGDRG